ncbi:MAG: Rpp14/Pop5 family protein [Methanomethylovorans sp.]|uniref:Rpp14/Pop5 family protein n=1 Tax=Methanomethylovorans sp. TaxID=2758717 RepID=UPI0035316793
MKTLPPSLRERKRYLAIEIIAEYDVSREELLREIFAAIGSLLGDIGSSECGLRLLDYDKQKGILRCSHMMSEKSRAALATITSIGGQRAIVHVLGISGTVRGATQKYIQCAAITETEHINI